METMLKAIISSTHVDIAWKKDIDEMSEIFEKVLLCLDDILKKHGEFTYVIEQAYLFRRIKERRIDLVTAFKEHIAQGRVEVVGGMASTIETNILNGESIIKNFLLGKNWFAQNLGAQIKVAWLIDTFGINAQIPQLTKQFGLSYLFANRLGGDKIHTRFIVKGLDGTYLPILGKDTRVPAALDEGLYWAFLQNWDQIDELFDRGDKSPWNGDFKLLMPYTENEITPSPRLVHNTKIFAEKGWKCIIPSDLIEFIQKGSSHWTEYGGDLNPEFTGTFSNRVDLRLRNREIENKLLELEKLLCLCGREECLSYKKTLDDLWWDMAFIQSHDVITGSLPTKVFKHAMETMERCDNIIMTISREILATKTAGTLGKDEYLLIWKGIDSDSLPYVSILVQDSFPEIESLEYCGNPLLFDLENNILKIFCPKLANGLYSFRIRKRNGDRILSQAAAWNECIIGNKKISARLSREKGIGELTLTGDMINVVRNISLVIQEDRGNFQIENPLGSEIESTFNIHELLIHDTPVIKKGILKGTFPVPPWNNESPPLSWVMECILNGDSPFIELKIYLHWQGEKSRVRLKIESTIDSAFHWDEIPFGVVKRGSYRDRGTCRGEWPVHRFSCIEGQGHGLALINFGTCGIEYSGSIIRSTLIRAPYTEYAGMIPDGTSSQHGDHCFSFLVVPYKGTWRENNIPLLAAAANAPVFSLETNALIAQGPLLACGAGNVIISSVSMASDNSGDILVRLYETLGIETPVNFLCRDGRLCWESDIDGNKNIAMILQDGRCEFKIKPFEIKTLRFTY
jgi:alpha-mannosidase